MTKIEAKTIKTAVKAGFTFSGDSIFSSYTQAKRTLNSLVRGGYLKAETDDDGRTAYVPTDAARDFSQYGITA